jgi:hypothetical protein
VSLMIIGMAKRAGNTPAIGVGKREGSRMTTVTATGTVAERGMSVAMKTGDVREIGTEAGVDGAKMANVA